MGYNIKESCEALCMPRSSYYASLQRNPTSRGVKEYKDDRDNEGDTKDDDLLQEIKAIKSDRPLLGYRKVRRSFGTVRAYIRVNRKKVYMLMKYGLTVSKETKKGRKGQNVSSPRQRDLKSIGGKFTKFMINSGWLGLFGHST